MRSRLTMEQTQRRSSAIRFGVFEVDLQAKELRKRGIKIKLQEQPFQILLVLLDRPGEVVTRDEFQKKLWPADTFVDFERGLNRGINKLREALGDDAESPRFIETLPRRGYRFRVPIEALGTPELVSTELEQKAPIAVVPRRDPGRQTLPWAVAAVLAVVAGLACWTAWRAPSIAAERPFLRLDLDAGPDGFSQPAISRDGMRIAFVSKGALAVRRLDQLKIARFAGTDGASFPFFSPNGQWVAFFAGRKLQKVAVEGSAPIMLCDAPDGGGGTWADDDNIFMAADGGLSRVPAAGGHPQRLTDSKADPAGPLMHLWPQALPGGRGVLFAAVNGSLQGSLRILTPKDGKLKMVIQNSTDGRYLASGYLVYYQRGTLFAAPMDAGRLELTGPAVPLVDRVSTFKWGRAEFDISASGTMVYRGDTPGTNSVASWIYSSGKIEPALSKPGTYASPRLSPDATQLALSVTQDSKQNLWVYDLRRETFNRLTFDAGPDWLPTWTPDGEFIAFRSGNSLAWIRSDGTGKVEHMAGVSGNAGPWSFSGDGKWLAFWPLQPASDLWIVPVDRTSGSLQFGQPQPLLQQAGSKGAPALSPDSRWVAYSSDASGRFEVYVMSLSHQGRATSRKWQVSNGGGWSPIWSRNGRELFYQSLDRQVEVAAYTVDGDLFVPEKPRAWSEKRVHADLPSFDVSPDGKRVLALLPPEDSRPQTFLRVVLNVDTELRRHVPTHSK